jgi:hypothetical protein
MNLTLTQHGEQRMLVRLLHLDDVVTVVREVTCDLFTHGHNNSRLSAVRNLRLKLFRVVALYTEYGVHQS